MSLSSAAHNISNYRAGSRLPASDIASPAQWLLSALGSKKTKAGVKVDSENMVSLSTVFAALNYIQDTYASLPMAVMRKTTHPDIKTGKVREKHPSHPAHNLVAHEPNRWMTSHTYRKVMMNQVLRKDNAFAFISRDGAARPLELMPLPADLYNVEPYLTERMDVVYRITGNGIPLEEVWVGSMDMIHIVGYTQNGLVGKDRSRLLKEALGTSMAGENWTSEFFGKGVNVSGFIRTPKELKTEEAVKRLKTSFAQAVAGPNNRFGVGVLENDAQWQPNETDPEKAQLNETRKINAITASQMFKIPLVFLNHLERATFNNMEQLGIWFAMYTIDPWCQNYNQEYRRKLLTEKEKQDDNIYFHHDLKALMRGDMAAFSQFVERLSKAGAYSPNKILELLDENGYPGGDIHVLNPGAVSVEQLNKNEDNDADE